MYSEANISFCGVVLDPLDPWLDCLVCARVPGMFIIGLFSSHLWERGALRKRRGAVWGKAAVACMGTVAEARGGGGCGGWGSGGGGTTIFYSLTGTFYSLPPPVVGSPAHHMAISADGNQKARRFMNAGTASSFLPTTSSFMGDVADKVIMAHADGVLTSRAEEARKRTEGREGPCAVQLNCNREVSTARGQLDRYGQVTAVCAHIIPGRGLTVPMPVPECHFFYTEVFREALTVRPDIKSIYLDLSCRYWPAFADMVADLVAGGHLNPDMEINLMLPWMHAFDHDIPCQLKHSGLYRVSVKAWGQ